MPTWSQSSCLGIKHRTIQVGFKMKQFHWWDACPDPNPCPQTPVYWEVCSQVCSQQTINAPELYREQQFEVDTWLTLFSDVRSDSVVQICWEKNNVTVKWSQRLRTTTLPDSDSGLCYIFLSESLHYLWVEGGKEAVTKMSLITFQLEHK